MPDVVLDDAPARQKEAEGQHHFDVGLDDVERGRNRGKFKAFLDGGLAPEGAAVLFKGSRYNELEKALV